MLSAGCPSSPTAPTEPPPVIPDPPLISCPTPPAQTSPNGQPFAVSFTTSVILGATPVTTTCTPPSGSLFPIGTTRVTCTATDARQRSASCSFNIVVQPSPTIRFTKIAAFGDSITWGEDGVVLTAVPTLPAFGFNVPTIRLVGREYPTVLQQLLSARYATQSISVLNNGNPGERTADPAAFTRFTQMTSSRTWEVVLLMQGTNDIFYGDATQVAPAIAALRRMIGDARSRGIRTFLATVPPMRAGGSRALGINVVPQLNAEIRLLATTEGVPLVDVFDAFNGNLALLAGDGLHPNADGYSVIATRFYDVVRRELETPPTTLGTFGARPGMIDGFSLASGVR